MNRENLISAAVIAWAGSLTMFYFVRFSFLFYEANRAPITALLKTFTAAQ